MSHPGRGLLRVARGGLLAVCCAMLALAGHVIGGGDVPKAHTWVAVAVLTGAGFSVLADRQRSFGQVLAGAVAAQAGFHLAFSLTGPGAGDHAQPAAGGSHGMGLPTDLAMVGGHLLAAAGTAALVTHGDTVLWSLVELLGLVRMPPLGAPLVVTVPCSPAPSPPDLPRPGASLCARAHPRRGPPLRTR
ncbi:hypothetical protein ABN034_00900 [Actinopolymorpha sp. B11F2]|uniref:hypothetical protein n=1 Tax=Actinopolymorpha sp. B11F2 TaxID=3160862 RepID=UPI0032E4D587